MKSYPIILVVLVLLTIVFGVLYFSLCQENKALKLQIVGLNQEIYDLKEQLGGAIECDAENPCPPGQECYSFEGEGLICWAGDPCEKCASNKCVVAESYPMQVFCK